MLKTKQKTQILNDLPGGVIFGTAEINNYTIMKDNKYVYTCVFKRAICLLHEIALKLKSFNNILLVVLVISNIIYFVLSFLLNMFPA